MLLTKRLSVVAPVLISGLVLGFADYVRCAVPNTVDEAAKTNVSSVSAGTRIEWYPLSPMHRSDGRVTGYVNGRPVEFEYFRNFPEYYFDVSYVRFAADGPVNVRLRVNGPTGAAQLRTVRQDIPFVKDGSSFTFSLPGPGHYYLKLPGLGGPEPENENSGTYTVLFFVDDLDVINAEKMDARTSNVRVATAGGLISDPYKDQTAEIQSLLDGAGSIYFPAGIYRSGSLRVSSDTTIYFAPGAVLKAVDDPEKIADEYIGIYGAENVRIFGPGIIDANYDGAGYDRMVHIINVDRSKRIVLEDMLIQNSVSWALHIRRSDFVKVDGMKIFSGKDGIDPDSSCDVIVDNVCVLSYDDAVAVKVRDPEHTTERVTIRDSILASKASALKVGTETRGLMRNVTFENCEVFDSDRGIIMYARDGGPIENVTWRDIHMSMVNWPTEDGGSPIQILITNRQKNVPTPTPVRNCTIENVTAFGTQSCELKGHPDAPLTGLKMKDITFYPQSPGPDKPPLIKVFDHVNVEVEGLTVKWKGNKTRWDGVVAGRGLTVKPAG